jgi:hypothetical protein
MSLRTIKERVEAATPGPWTADEVWWVCQPGEDGDIIVDGATPPEPADAAFVAHARTDVPALLRVAEAVAMMPTPVELNGCCTFCDAVMDVDQMTDDGHWPHEVDCPLGMAHRSLADLEALP